MTTRRAPATRRPPPRRTRAGPPTAASSTGSTKPGVSSSTTAATAAGKSNSTGQSKKNGDAQNGDKAQPPAKKQKVTLCEKDLIVLSGIFNGRAILKMKDATAQEVVEFIAPKLVVPVMNELASKWAPQGFSNSSATQIGRSTDKTKFATAMVKAILA